jgi:hypothetical protein
MYDDPPPPRPPSQPLLATGWQRGCGLTIMILGIVMTSLSGLCTGAMTIADLSSGSHGGGDVNLTGIQFVVGGPFIILGGLMWLGGWALSRKRQAPADSQAGDDGPGPTSPPA